MTRWIHKDKTRNSLRKNVDAACAENTILRKQLGVECEAKARPMLEPGP